MSYRKTPIDANNSFQIIKIYVLKTANLIVFS